MLKTTNLTKYFHSGQDTIKAVDDVSFEVNKGELVLIIGPSGSGKTTLLMLLGLLLKPDKGELILCGTNPHKLNEKQTAKLRRELLGFVFQDYLLIPALNAWENVALIPSLSKKTAAKEQAESILKSFGMGKHINSQVQPLSGGEKQRVALARALINKPDLILADEPTSNLDTKHGLEVIEHIRESVKKNNHAAIVVSHDTRLQQYADQILVMEDGKVKEY